MDVIDWLSQKLEEPWSAHKVVSLLTNELIQEVNRKVHELEPAALVRVMLACLQLRPNQLKEMQHNLNMLLETCAQMERGGGAEEARDVGWVRVVAQLLGRFGKLGYVDCEERIAEPVLAILNECQAHFDQSLQTVPQDALPEEARFLHPSLLPPIDRSNEVVHFQVVKPFSFEPEVAPEVAPLQNVEEPRVASSTTEPLSVSIPAPTEDASPRKKSLLTPGSVTPSARPLLNANSPAAATWGPGGRLPPHPSGYKRKQHVKVLNMNDAFAAEARTRKRGKLTEDELAQRKKDKIEMKRKEKEERETRKREEREAKKREKEEQKLERERTRREKELELEQIARDRLQQHAQMNTGISAIAASAFARTMALPAIPVQPNANVPAVHAAAAAQTHVPVVFLARRVPNTNAATPAQPLQPSQFQPSLVNRPAPAMPVLNAAMGPQSLNDVALAAAFAAVQASHQQQPMVPQLPSQMAMAMPSARPAVTAPTSQEQQSLAVMAQLFEKANMLTSADRELIQRFFRGESVADPRAVNGCIQLTLNEHSVRDELGNVLVETMVFEMNFQQKSWRKLKRRRKHAES